MIEKGLRDKVVVVTGAARGIGRATALRFAREGAKVTAWDVSDEKAESFVNQVKAMGATGLFRRVDVTDASAVETSVRDLILHWGRVHVLINDAGITRDAQLARLDNGQPTSVMSDAEFDSVIAVNLPGFLIAHVPLLPT
jgi:3-oxoacyl-[acyl-carrier protein] reductase